MYWETSISCVKYLNLDKWRRHICFLLNLRKCLGRENSRQLNEVQNSAVLLLELSGAGVNPHSQCMFRSPKTSEINCRHWVFDALIIGRGEYEQKERRTTLFSESIYKSGYCYCSHLPGNLKVSVGVSNLLTDISQPCFPLGAQLQQDRVWVCSVPCSQTWSPCWKQSWSC